MCAICSSHALTSDVSIEETARAAEFFLSDGVIITGAATGVQANPEEFRGAVCITVELSSCSITLVRKFSSSKRNCLTVIKFVFTTENVPFTLPYSFYEST